MSDSTHDDAAYVKPFDRVEAPDGAQGLALVFRDGLVLVEYDEGSEAWVPIQCLRHVVDGKPV